MKKMISLLLVLAMLMTILSGCGQQTVPEEPTVETQSEHEEIADTEQTTPEEHFAEIPEQEPPEAEKAPVFGTLEDEIYAELSNSLDPEQYRVEDISTTYISKEYLEEIQYNSQKNIFFGYSLPELDAQFEGTRYVFTMDEDGKTTVEELVEVSGIGSEEILEIAQKGLMLVRVVVKVTKPGQYFGKIINLLYLITSEANENNVGNPIWNTIGTISGTLVKIIPPGSGADILKEGLSAVKTGCKVLAIIGATTDLLWKTSD